MINDGRSTRDGWMRRMRERQGLTVADMARKCRCSIRLLHILEEGGETLPGMVLQIGEVYGMNETQMAAILCDATMARELREGGRDAKRLLKLLAPVTGDRWGIQPKPRPKATGCDCCRCTRGGNGDKTCDAGWHVSTPDIHGCAKGTPLPRKQWSIPRRIKRTGACDC